MQEAFDKLRGVDIFSLKSYMEPTGFASFNGAWVLINELFVNFFFFHSKRSGGLLFFADSNS